MSDNVLLMDKMTKVYPNGFVANKDVTLSVNRGEIHALLGENGAGKTTLMKMLFGFERPDGGRILIDGKEVKIKNALEAIHLGIGMVHQHFMLVPSMTVTENLILGDIPKGSMFTIDSKKAVETCIELGKKYNMVLDPTMKAMDLSVGGKQKLEILKALLLGAKILILDEPTAVLTPQETKELFETLKILAKDGHTIIFISHKLDEVIQICDRYTILRRGKQVGSGDVAKETPSSLSAMMVGREIDLDMHKDEVKFGEIVLEVKDLVFVNDFDKRVVNGIDFAIHASQILGIAAVEGNGQNEVAEIITGLKKASVGEVILAGTSITNKTIRDRRELGVAYIPEDRMVDGCASSVSIKDNLVADRFFKPKFSKNFFIDQKAIESEADRLIKEFQVMCMDKGNNIGALSGGNIQKVIVAREFTSDAKLVVANQPTRGIDVGAAEYIRHRLVDISRQEGVGVLLVSADLTELLTVSDSLMVMVDGKITAYFEDASKVDEYMIGEYMLGVKKQSEEEIGGAAR
ncbi:MAG: ABC transporter ATP-binding protein [Erysipelotrichales bacterium]|nr:ABC transporter ATP-binding protein [Erysipelotrichales bacterium]